MQAHINPADNPYGLESLWQQGDMVIKTVALILLLMSLASWWVMALRSWRLLALRQQARRGAGFWQAGDWTAAMNALGAQPGNPFAALAEAGRLARQQHRSAGEAASRIALGDWLAERLRDVLDGQQEGMQAGLPLLASVGATAPFIGLFGTVWGIHHALVKIGVSGQADIGQVAGPVGEALIMTAFGLAVAIPAVLGYNALLRGNRTQQARLQGFARQLHARLLLEKPPVAQA